MNAEHRTICHECQAPNATNALFCARCGASLRTAVSPDPLPRRRRTTPRGAALGVALLVVLIAAVFVLGMIVYRTMGEEQVIDPLAGRSGTAATTSTTLAEGSGTQGSTTTTEVRGVLLRPQAVSSSSALEATKTNSYRATNLLDDDLATAWNEGASGPGLGEWVRFDFSAPVVLARIEIANGYQKDDERFKKNIRIRSLKLEYSDGFTQLIDLLDTKTSQGVAARQKPTEWLKLTIVSVYPDYVWEDAALSEVRIFEVATQ